MSDELNEHPDQPDSDSLDVEVDEVHESPADKLAERAELDALETEPLPATGDVDSYEAAAAPDEGSNVGFAFLALALLVLVGAGVFFVGSLSSSADETAQAQQSAEEALAEFNADPGVVVTLPPESIPMVDEDEASEEAADDAEPDVAESTTTTTEVAFPSVDPANIAMAFVHRVPGDHYGKVGYIDAEGERQLTELECDRLDLNEAGGICLSATAGLAGTGRGLLLQPDLNATTRFGVNRPSRAAVSPDGAVVAWTGFSLGHSYLDVGEFATTTQLISVERGIAADLETIFTTYDLEGNEAFEIDRNFWGVSFADSDLFYATYGTGETTSIVEGRVSTSRLDVVVENATCPEVSPDGTRFVAKEQRGDMFQLVLIDVETGQRTDLGETRSVDDQVEWLDDSTVLYGLPNPDEGTAAQPAFDIWSVNVAPGSTPELVVPFADSPAA